MKITRLLIFGLLLAAFVASCKKSSDPAPSPYDNANISAGGIMYDKFWSTEAGFDQNNPNIENFKAYGDFFRCKQCHGWDLYGTFGSYNNRGPKKTRPNVAALNLFTYVQSKSPDELFNGMKRTTNRRDVAYDLSTYDPITNPTIGDQMPNFTQILTDAQIWNIVKFLKAGAFDVIQLYDATYTGTYPTGQTTITNIGKNGNATNGNNYFTVNCVSCHGADGTQISLEDMTLGNFLRKKPNEVQHKVKYGTLGSAMIGQFDITIGQMADLYKALADSANFPNN